MISYLGVLLITGATYTVSDDAFKYREELQKMYPGYGTEFVIFPGEDGKPVFAYFKNNFGSKFLDLMGRHDDIENKIHFTLFNRQNLKGVNGTNFKLLTSNLRLDREIKIVTHGWMSSGKAKTCVQIKDNYLNTSDVDVFIMDWSALADNLIYTIPMEQTWTVGKHYGAFLNHLIEDVGISAEQMHLIGHSLGAHVTGFAARQVRRGKVGRITGLDPAMPGFTNHLVKGDHLRANDSLFVDIIHTCAGFLGLKEAIGHADFYPNGGTPPQPGCDSILAFLDSCSHGRSHKLFADSIILPYAYMSTKCRSYRDFEENKCSKARKVPMGQAAPRDARGVFYLKTGSKDPFLLDHKKKN